MAADILGVKLSRSEMEQQQRIVKAEIVTYNTKETIRPPPQQKSSMCIVQ